MSKGLKKVELSQKSMLPSPTSPPSLAGLSLAPTFVYSLKCLLLYSVELLTSISNSQAGGAGALTGKEGNAKPQTPCRAANELRKSRKVQLGPPRAEKPSENSS